MEHHRTAPRVVVELKGGDANGAVTIALLDEVELGPDAHCQSPAFPLNLGLLALVDAASSS